MLKALELVGFKSFADKTRFEFPPGITVVVGPNGSGKSNIVDAIKWVLGEQSAKSLRGKDMADVIFKGSGSGRRVMNTAEATIIFDNSEGRLAVDAPEVHVTRRVYRSGEGEYLINRQPCRLRDIRDMFRGTGVGTDAYSLIEQGKVDRMLQASSKDRRHIFEEAAGISRFKAKKIEAQRRLERVENNLVRLSDIVDEVESRLRSIRSQASKARRYREYSDRLQQLRTQVGWSDWRRLTNQLHEAEAELQAIQSESQERSQEAAGVQQQIENISARLQAGTRQVHDTETRLGRLREAITAGETETKHGFDRCREWEQDVHSFRSRLLATSLRAGELEGRLADARGQLADARARFDEASGKVTAQEQIVQQLAEKTQELREENKSHRLTYMEQVREATILTTQVGNLKRQIEDDAVVVNRSDERLASMNADFQRLHDELASAEQSLEQLDGQLRENRSLIEAGEIELAETRQILDRRQKEITIYRARLSGKQERAALLAEMEHRREGIGRGVRELLEKAEQGRDGFADVCGLLADLVQAKVESAPLIDALLGPSAQFVVVKGVDLIDALAARKLTLTGRVGLVPLTVARTATETPGLPTPDGTPVRPTPAPRTAVGTAASGVQEMDGVIGPADDLFECEPVYRPLIQRFLADAWVVRDLATAVSLRRGGFNARFVTLAAEVIEVDGTLVVGDEAAGDGLISRRSELNALAQEIGVIERQIEREEKELQRLEENIDRQQRRIRQLTNQQRELSSERAEQRVIVNTLVQTGQSLEKQIDTLRRERDAASDRGSRSDGELRESENRLIELDELNKRHEGQIEVNEQQLKSLDERRQKESHAATSARVAFARCQEEVAALEGQVAQFEEDHRERSRAVGEVREQLRHAQERIEKTERLLLETSARLSGQFLEKDARTAEIAELAFQQLDDEQQRVELTGQRESLEQRVRRLESKYHKQELAAGEVRHQRATLAERLRDDYGIDIEAHDAESGEANEEEQQQREQIDDEIASLRRKISNIGAVNMEALHELDDLEERFNSLSGQYQDLTQAKDALLRIISRINADSRRLFMETLEAIRANFQVLYRHAFGGGNADLVMEEGADPLEAGVEIIATPPGKPSFNNSLLSGGEKALTAVSLLLAIFQFRPSPFCVLDEVNAPFDEANIGRFVDVLKGFLGWTKFVIVTHSKKTMTAAHTLYGVTMQESGVSKQVSVSFEDVSEDGHISPDAIKRAERSTQDDAA